MPPSKVIAEQVSKADLDDYLSQVKKVLIDNVGNADSVVRQLYSLETELQHLWVPHYSTFSDLLRCEKVMTFRSYSTRSQHLRENFPEGLTEKLDFKALNQILRVAESQRKPLYKLVEDLFAKMGVPVSRQQVVAWIRALYEIPEMSAVDFTLKCINVYTHRLTKQGMTRALQKQVLETLGRTADSLERVLEDNGLNSNPPSRTAS